MSTDARMISDDLEHLLKHVSLVLVPSEPWFLGDVSLLPRKSSVSSKWRETKSLIGCFGERIWLAPSQWSVTSPSELAVLEMRSSMNWTIVETTESDPQGIHRSGTVFLEKALRLSNQPWVFLAEMSLMNEQSLKYAKPLLGHTLSYGHQNRLSPSCFIAHHNNKVLSLPSVWPRALADRIKELREKNVENLTDALNQLPTLFFDYEPALSDIAQKRRLRKSSDYSPLKHTSQKRQPTTMKVL